MVWSHNPFFPQAKPSGPAPGSAPPPADNASDAEAGLVPKEEIPGEGMPSTGTPSTDEAGPSSSSAEGSDTAHQHHYHRPHFHSDPALQHHVHMPRLHHHIHEMRKPSEKFTPYQIFYIFVLDGLGAAIISGGVNFAIAYAMYNDQDPAKHPVRLFQLRNTLAGDAGVTTIIQCIITWMIELMLVNMDLRTGHVQPIGFIPEPKWKFLRWFSFLDRTKQLNEPGSFWHWFWFITSQLLRGLITAVPSFCLMWGPAVGILTAVGDKCGGDWCFHDKWAPQVFKLIYGAVLGLITTPLFTIFWLTRCGWALKTNEGHYGER